MTEKFYVTLGDWSGDGHNVTETFTVVLEGDFTTEQLAENYKSNVNKIGFDIQNVAAEYEESEISIGQLNALKSHGFVFMDETAEKEGYLRREEYLNALMFFFVHGLNVSWSLEEKPKYQHLAGYGHSVIGYEQYGYGLYGT